MPRGVLLLTEGWAANRMALDRAWECWAFFADRVAIKPQRVISMAEDDPSLHDAARLLGLDIETDAGAIITPWYNRPKALGLPRRAAWLRPVRP